MMALELIPCGFWTRQSRSHWSLCAFLRNRSDTLSSLSDLQVFQYPRCCFRTRAYAIRHSDTPISVPGECQPCHLRNPLSNACNTLTVPYSVQRHGVVPLINPDEARLRRDPENLFQFAADKGFDLGFGFIENV